MINHHLGALASAPSKIRSKQYSTFVLDLSAVEYVRSLPLTLWRCLVDLALMHGMQVNVIPPTQTDPKDYAGRMGLFAGTSYVYPYSEKKPERFFPLMKISNDQNELLFEESQRVFSYCNATNNYVNRLCEAFSELADNIYFHSGEKENTGWGYVHAQAYPKRGNITIALVDVGVGFYGSYSRTNQIRGRTEMQLLEDSFNELESSLNQNPGRGHRGIGLFEVREFIKKFTGSIGVRSGSSELIVTQVQMLVEQLNYDVDGTWIELTVPIL